MDKATDYQKVLDSRWRFMEVELEVDAQIVVPTYSTQAFVQYQKVVVAEHNLGFVPFFHADFELVGAPEFESYSGPGALYCNEKELFFERAIYTPAGNTAPSYPLKVRAKIYNLNAFQEYRAISEVAGGVGRAESSIGVRALDGSDSNVKIDSSSPKGFSIDTKKKILSVHKVSTKFINEEYMDSARVTAVDAGTNVLTIANNPNGHPDSTTGILWVKTGEAVGYSPNDFTTFPNPLGGSTYYIIKISDTQIQLALSKANAEAGIAIDLTSAGSLPAQIGHIPTVDSNRILHETGYPPSYLFCEYEERSTGKVTMPIFHVSTTPLVRADNNYLYFGGVQAAYIARLAYIILKDPVELAS